MLTEAQKQRIQSCYSQLLKSKGLGARHGQKQMIAEIARSLADAAARESGADGPGGEGGAEGEREAEVCVVEAGTGTGKTIAYLVPAIPLAQALDKKLVIATATVALQEQVMHKDLPDLLANCDLRFSYALAKGRGRYLCLSRLDQQLRGNDSQDALRDLFGLSVDDDGGAPDQELYQRMLEALGEGRWQGDRDDWPEALDERQWRHVAVEHGQCAGSRCPHFGNCTFFRARDQLQKADCIVANHDLVLADLSLGGGVILPAPEDCIYVFDEAHHLPLKGIAHFAHVLRLRAGLRWLDQMPQAFERLRRDSAGRGALEPLLEAAGEQARLCAEGLRESLLLFEQFHARADADGRGDQRVFTFPGGAIEPGLREHCRGLCEEFAALGGHLGRILDLIRQCLENDGGELERERAEAWYPLFGGMQTRADAAEGLYRHFGAEDRPGEAPSARWLNFSELGGEAEVMLSCSPVLAADALDAHLWRQAFAVILTSATLTALESFDFLRLRAGLPANSRCTRIPSPFDFKRVGLSVPARGFDPADNAGHTRAIIDCLPRILKRDEGSLVLFSSRRQMQEVLAGLPPEWLQLSASQDDFSKQELLARHRARIDRGEGSVLFGLASLAEGVDLPGDYCRHVVIAKIPFAVPNDPVEATLAHWVEARGGNAFNEIAVPEAATRLIQACGRLLRSEGDSGRITILDQRLHTRRYGRAILDSLPPYRREAFPELGSVV